ncbi:MAG: HEAT repeat domain-containing protein [Candidatus Wallbacteria bacterium]|nr:HEAT repeat domain-containing protein [Candidatus Wallbacteria bacterium]
MSSPLITCVEAWAAHEQPLARRQALRWLEERLDVAAADEVSRVLDRFERDRDGWTQSLARRIRRRVRETAAMERSGTLLETSSDHGWRPADMLALTADEIREAAVELLRPCVQELLTQARAVAASSPAGEELWRVLAALGHPDAVAEATRLLREGSATGDVLEVLARGGDPGAARLVAEVAAGKSAALRPRALALSAGLRGADAMSGLQSAAVDASATVRFAAAAALSRQAGARPVDLLVSLTGDGSPRVALAALRGLAGKRDPRIARRLEQMAFGKGDFRVRAEALRALVAQPAEPPLAGVQSLLDEPVGEELLAAAIEAAAILVPDATRSEFILKRFYDHFSPLARAAALAASAPSRGAQAVSAIEEMLGAALPGVRRAGAAAATRMLDAGLCRKLVERFCQEDVPSVQAALMAALTKLAPGCPPDALQPLPAHPAPHLAPWCVDLVANLPEPAWTAQLERLAADAPDQETRERALLAMVGRRGQSELKQCLNAGRPSLACRAVERVDAFSAFEVASLVEPLLASADPWVQAGAAVALWKFGQLDKLRVVEKLLSGARRSDQQRAGLRALESIARTLDVAALERHPDLLQAICARTERRPQTPDTTSGVFAAAGLVSGPQPIAVRPDSGAQLAAAPAQEPSLPAPAAGWDVRIEELLRAAASDAMALREAARSPESGLDGTAEGVYLKLHELMGAEAPEGWALARSLLESAPGPMVTPYLELGQVFARRWDQPASVRAYLQAFQAQLGVIQELAAALAAKLDSGKWQAAQAGLDLLTRVMPLNAELHRVAGEFYLRNRGLEAACRQLFMAHVVAPGDLRVTIELAVACIQTGRRDLARALATSVLEREPAGSPWADKASGVLKSLERKK